jgi:alkylation response protein AidB-like acyl-CoA dehydrogenase
MTGQTGDQQSTHAAWVDEHDAVGLSETGEPALLGAVEQLAPVIRAHAQSAEIERRLSRPVVDAMLAAGLYRLWIPRAFGGLEVDPVTAFRVFEEVSRIDSAAGWNLQLSVAIAPFLAWISDEGAAEIFRDPNVILGGTLNPPARAVPAAGGYRVTGRMPFVSGCHSCTWFLAPAQVIDGDQPRLNEAGVPLTLIVLYPAKDAEIIDNWNTLGMRGTGSHDVAITNVFVPERRTAPLVPLERLGPAFQGPLYRHTIWPSVAALATIATGIARAALDEAIALAHGKTPAYTASRLRERPVAQSQIAQAEALLGAARAYLYESLRDTWPDTVRGRWITAAQKMKMQLAATHAVVASAQVVDLVHAAAGTTGIRNEYRLQQHFRDVHVITQHAFISANRYESMGKVLFGVPTDWPFFAL